MTRELAAELVGASVWFRVFFLKLVRLDLSQSQEISRSDKECERAARVLETLIRFAALDHVGVHWHSDVTRNTSNSFCFAQTALHFEHG